ncbi:MAG: HAMP domain-containing histidine kinase [Thaumarchaeota archaeon]|nr:HAMP domain-containing histidine kinase [Nitrososphaerota archaeon]
MARFINKKDPSENPANNGRMIFFSKAPGQGTEAEIEQITDSHNATEFEKATTNSSNSGISSKPYTEERYTTINSIIEEEKKELQKIQELIRKRSETLDLAKKQLREKQNLLQTHLDKRSNKFTVVGEMSSKMVHDIKNPLTVIKAQVDLLKLRYSKEEDSTLLNSLGRMEQAVNGITNHINDILNFIRETPSTFENNSILKILNESVIYANKPDNVSINLPTNDVVASCDATKLQRVFTNIIVNSIQALEKGGTITIQISEQNNNAIIQISDSGPGIPSDVLPKVFEPLFTTKKEGTGLGLPTCKKIIEEEHAGSIAVKNDPTTFTITVPKTQQ